MVRLAGTRKATGNTTRYFYDGLGRLSTMFDPLDRSTLYKPIRQTLPEFHLSAEKSAPSPCITRGAALTGVEAVVACGTCQSPLRPFLLALDSTQPTALQLTR
jgi:YD repeat-containing protein